MAYQTCFGKGCIGNFTLKTKAGEIGFDFVVTVETEIDITNLSFEWYFRAF